MEAGSPGQVAVPAEGLDRLQLSAQLLVLGDRRRHRGLANRVTGPRGQSCGTRGHLPPVIERSRFAREVEEVDQVDGRHSRPAAGELAEHIEELQRGLAVPGQKDPGQEVQLVRQDLAQDRMRHGIGRLAEEAHGILRRRAALAVEAKRLRPGRSDQLPRDVGTHKGHRTPLRFRSSIFASG